MKLTIYDITKDNIAKIKGNDEAMWKAVKMLSDKICYDCKMTDEEYWAMLKEYYTIMAGCHFNENFAKWQIDQMYYIDMKGIRHDSPHWTMAQLEEVYNSVKPKIKNDYNKYDFAVTMEMMYSDNICMYRQWWPDADDSVLTQKVIDASINYLNDTDDTNGKIWKRFHKCYM